MKRYTFHGFAAYLGRVDGERRVAVWTEDPRGLGFDTAKLVPIDLSRTPYAAQVNAIGWDEVQVDNPATVAGSTWPIKPDPGYTTLDPKWPFTRTRGAVFLEAQYVQLLRNLGYHLASLHTQVGAHDYEYTTVLEVEEKPGAPADVVRYNPYHGRLETDGTVTLWERGQSGNANPNPACKKVPVADLHHAHNCHQQIGTLLPKGLREGSVLLTPTYMKAIAMNGPKVPHYDGI